ncbi:hypothetical protein QYE76_020306 [Lolium multiflorum]|uniref:Chromo domain-containing protein n=1 Tax=Lolium multiflorum TaxID=4521 RepID=A0AAD8R845_LOLMU|nr:hypothetical protein QYE76_020306 [Lolium multiflorum]
MEALQKMIAEMSLELKSGMSSLQSGLSSVETKLESTQASVDVTASSIHSLNTWKGAIDTQVSDLGAAVQDLRKQVERIAVGAGLSALGPPPTNPGAPPLSATSANMGSGINPGPTGHGSTNTHRGQMGNQLMVSLSTPVTVSLELPQLGEDMAKPDMVLGTRLQPTAAGSKRQVLVRWQGLPDALATWENKEDMQHRFPEFPAWGQAGSQGEGNVMDLTNDVAFSATGKQRRRLRRAGRKPARISGPEWTK